MERQTGKYKVTKIRTLKNGHFEGSAVAILDPADDGVGKITLITDSIELTGLRTGKVYAFQEVQA